MRTGTLQEAATAAIELEALHRAERERSGTGCRAKPGSDNRVHEST